MYYGNNKSELAAIDRKITAELAPKHDENDGIENKQKQSQQHHPDEKIVSVETTQQMSKSFNGSRANNKI